MLGKCTQAVVAAAVLLAASAPLFGQATTTVSDTFVGPDGAPVQLRMSIRPNFTFNTADGYVVPNFSAANGSTNGAFTVKLVPNTGSTPAGTSYRVDYSLNGVPYHETWVVPASSTPVKLATVRTLIPPPPSSFAPASSAGDMNSLDSTPKLARVAANRSGTMMFLSQLGSGV